MESVLMLFNEYLEKEDVLSKLIENNNAYDYGYSEIHTIVAIKDLKEANVTNISKHLKMTKGAISKITKRLISKGLIKSYTLASNKQKIFFELTDEGSFMYEEHKRGHELWIKRDSEFMNQFSKEDLSVVIEFMKKYNKYLEDKIKSIEG